MKITCKVQFKTQVWEGNAAAAMKNPELWATHKKTSDSPWKENLLFDQGLNGLAGSGSPLSLRQTPDSCFAYCCVGSGTNPNSQASGAITFTQSGTALTASGSFFSIGMIGQLFKYGTGTGGAEYYITGFTSDTSVTVDTSATVSTPTVGTVWKVNQTLLQTPLWPTDSYRTLAGDNSTTLGASTCTHQRTLVISNKGTTYNVNEIGYAGNLPSGAASNMAGRFVLPSTDVVTPTQYYLIIMQFVAVYSPGTPTAVSNVGTTIDTSGNLMLETIGRNGLSQVNSNGTSTGGGGLENGSSLSLYFSTAAYTQNGSPATSTTGGISFPTAVTLPSASWAYAGSRGTMQLNFTGSTTTAGGLSYGIGIGPTTSQIQLDVKLTTPYTFPIGLFQPLTVWQCVFDRALSN